MDLRHLECFLAVARTLHFGQAAEELYLSQPTVSESVKRLEAELGGQLFDRTTRRVSLTPTGELFAVEAQAALDRLALAYDRGRAFGRDRVTELRLGFSFAVSEFLDPMAELQRRHPGVVVSVRGLSTARQMQMLGDGRLDAAFCVMPRLRSGFDTMACGTCGLVAVARCDDGLSRREAVSLRELAAEPLIGWPRSSNPELYDCFAGAMDASGGAWTLVGTASGHANVAARVLAGFGVGVLFDSVLEERPPAGLRFLRLIDGPVVERSLVWRSDDRRTGLDEFIELVRDAIHQHQLGAVSLGR